MDSTTTGPPVAVPPDVRKLIGQYVKLRDRKRALEQQHKDQLAPYTTLMDEVEGKLLAYMQQINTIALRTDDGTAYQSVKLSATIKDGEAFRMWVIANGQFDLIDWRANANHVFDYLNEHKVQPPGLNLSTYLKINFRRPSE